MYFWSFTLSYTVYVLYKLFAGKRVQYVQVLFCNNFLILQLEKIKLKIVE